MNIKKTAILVLIITILSKILGFIREMVMAYFFGVSYITDAYLISLIIPVVIFGFIGIAINVAYIPLYTGIENHSGVENADRYTSNLVNIFLFVNTFIFILSYIFSGDLIKVFAVGFDKRTYELAVAFTKISLGGTFLLILISVSIAYLQIKKKFAITVLVGIPVNVILIFSIILSKKINIMILPWTRLIALVVQFLLLYIFVWKSGYRHKFKIDFKDLNIKKMALIVIPSVVGLSINSINVIIDKTLASTIFIGGVAVLNYANTIIQILREVFVISILNVFYPNLSKSVSEKRIQDFKNQLKDVTVLISFIIIPCSVSLWILKIPVIKLFYGRGNFDNSAVILTSKALFFYSLGLIGFALREVLTRAFYAMQDTKIPAINAAIAMFVNIILNFVLSKYLGLDGLALATSIAAIVAVILLFRSLKKKLEILKISEIFIPFIKIFGSSLIMGGSMYFLFNNMFNGCLVNIALILTVFISGIVYLISIYLMNIEELKFIFDILRNFFCKLKYKNI